MQVFHADVLIDGSGEEPLRNAEIFVEDGVIQDVAPAGTRARPQDAQVYDESWIDRPPRFHRRPRPSDVRQRPSHL